MDSNVHDGPSAELSATMTTDYSQSTNSNFRRPGRGGATPQQKAQGRMKDVEGWGSKKIWCEFGLVGGETKTAFVVWENWDGVAGKAKRTFLVLENGGGGGDGGRKYTNV